MILFINKENSVFAIIVIYINNLNIIATLEEIAKVVNSLKKKIEFKIYIYIYKLSQPIDQIFEKLNCCSLINLYRKVFKKILHEQKTSIEYPNGCLLNTKK